MIKPRIIPSLQIKNNKLVKTIKFQNDRYIGDPLNAIKIFNEKEVDEIIILDITNELNEINFHLIKNMADEAFMPLSYGGGIKNLQQVKKIFKIGIEKVILNQVAISNPTLITDISNIAGVSSVVVAINTKKNSLGNYTVYSSDGQNDLEIDLIDYICKIEKLGAGEIVVCDIDRDGTKIGINEDLIEPISKTINVPFLLTGGCSGVNNCLNSINKGASGVVAGSTFLFHGKFNAVLINYPTENEIFNNV